MYRRDILYAIKPNRQSKRLFLVTLVQQHVPKQLAANYSNSSDFLVVFAKIS